VNSQLQYIQNRFSPSGDPAVPFNKKTNVENLVILSLQKANQAVVKSDLNIGNVSGAKFLTDPDPGALCIGRKLTAAVTMLQA
jgi:hypothetical protein